MLLENGSKQFFFEKKETLRGQRQKTSVYCGRWHQRYKRPQ
jgi:hypothetical protein